MSYRGRPSKGCEMCRTRKIKCDEAKPICTRCLRSGLDCRYRDQAEMMFRNQTSVAAQKAEDAWRQRTKSRQRAACDTNTSRQVTSDDQPAPQTALSLLQTPDSTTGESQRISFPPAMTFSELSISPRIGTNLRRLAYERFVYDFVVLETPNKAPGALSDGMYDFIPTLYQRASDTSLVITIVDAVSYANFANRRNAPEARALGEECWGRAIKLLQTALAEKNQAPTDEVLCSVYLMGIYGKLATTETEPQRAHRIGARALLQLRTDNSYHSSLSARLYELIHLQALVGSLQAGTSQLLPMENIIATSHYLPSFYSKSGLSVMQLMHNEAHLHARWHNIKNNAVLPASRSGLQDILQAALDLEVEFQAWESTTPRDWRCQMERNTAGIRGTYDSRWRRLMLESRGAPDEIHEYSNLRRCWIWLFYRTVRLFLLRDLLEILNWMFKLPEPDRTTTQAPSSFTNDSGRSALQTLDNVELRIHHSFATTHLVSVVDKSCSAVIGNFTVPIHGKSDQDVSGVRGLMLTWSLGIMDAILKSGLVPDTGNPLTPPNSNEASPKSSIDPVFNLPAPSPSVFKRPVTNSYALYHQPPVHVPQTNDFPSLSPIATVAPGTTSTQPNVASSTSPTPLPNTPGSLGHVFDSSGYHPFDSPPDLPKSDFTITETAHMDVSARREWINRVLYYIGTDLGIKRAMSVPASEGYLDMCKIQVEALFGPHP